MKFTWLTYFIAIRRSFKLEYEAFRDHSGAFRGPNPWRRHMRITSLLRRRRRREGKFPVEWPTF